MDEASASVPFPVCSERVLETDIGRRCVGRPSSIPSWGGVSPHLFVVTKSWDSTAEEDDSRGSRRQEKTSWILFARWRFTIDEPRNDPKMRSAYQPHYLVAASEVTVVDGLGAVCT